MADTNLSLVASVADAIKKEAEGEGTNKEGADGSDNGSGEGTDKGAKDDKSGTGDGTPDGTDKGTKKEDTEGEDDGVIEIDASPEEINNALALFRSIANPQTRSAALAEIARNAGIKLETKADETKLAKDVATVLKEALGDSFELLSGDKLAVGLERIIKQEAQKLLDPVLSRLNEAEATRYKGEADNALSELWKRQKIDDPKVREQISGKMLAKMKVMPASKDANANEYLDDIFALVHKGDSDSRQVRDKITRIKTNAKETQRVSGEGGDEKRIKTGSKLPSVHESVQAAMRGERLEE